jgi:hypothetical protein
MPILSDDRMVNPPSGHVGVPEGPQNSKSLREDFA